MSRKGKYTISKDFVQFVDKNCTEEFCSRFCLGNRTPQERHDDVVFGTVHELFAQKIVIDAGRQICDANSNVLTISQVVSNYFKATTFDDGIDFYVLFQGKPIPIQVKSTKTNWYKFKNVDKDLRCIYSGKQPTLFMMFYDDNDFLVDYDISTNLSIISVKDLAKLVKESQYDCDTMICCKYAI